MKRGKNYTPEKFISHLVKEMEARQHAALFQQDMEPTDLHGDNSNIWGPKIDRMRISEYKIMPDIRKSICTIQNEVLFTPDDGVSF